MHHDAESADALLRENAQLRRRAESAEASRDWWQEHALLALEQLRAAKDALLAARRQIESEHDMKLTTEQLIGLSISMEKLADGDLTDCDRALLIAFAHLIEQIRENVARAIAETDAARYEREHGEPPF